MIYAAPVKHSGEREKKLAKDGGGGTAVGTLLNKVLLLGNSSNSTRQWGGGTTVSGLLHLSHYMHHYKKAEGPEPTLSKEGDSGASQDETEKNARAGR